MRARVAAVLRRAAGSPGATTHRVGALKVDCVRRTATVNGVALELTAKEWELLVTLAAEPERVFTKDELMRAVWNYRHCATTRALDSHAVRLVTSSWQSAPNASS